MSGVCLLATILGRGRAAAEPPEREPLPAAKQTANLDGLYLLIGVEGGPIRIASAWDSSVGGHVGLVSYAEGRAVSLLGLDLGMAQYGERAGGRIWLAPTIGTDRLGALIGASAGVAAEWEPFAREQGMTHLPTPRVGALATLWVFAGVVPYIGVGTFAQTGEFVEVGVRLALPAIRFTRNGLL